MESRIYSRAASIQRENKCDCARIHTYVYIRHKNREKKKEAIAPTNLDEGATEMHKTPYPTNAGVYVPQIPIARRPTHTKYLYRLY